MVLSKQLGNCMRSALGMPFVGADELTSFFRRQQSVRSTVGLAEHSNVMGKVLVSSYLRPRAAWLVFRRIRPPKPTRMRIAGVRTQLGGWSLTPSADEYG
jgi:hypothetical protein